MKKKISLLNTAFILVGLLLSIQTFCRSPKKDIEKLNNSIIFDLFFNYELTEKHDNLSTIIDFFPSPVSVNYKNIKLTTNVGGEDQVIIFYFNNNGKIEKASYTVNNMIYRYDFIYNKNQLVTINITDKPKIFFSYDKKGKLLSITRKKGGGELIYNFEYLPGENKADIKLLVVVGEKRRPSPSKYYLTWNEDFRLESIRFGRYISKNIIYTSKGDLESYSFSKVDKDNIISSWDYITFDEQQNWTKRESKNVIFTRTIEYR